MIFTKGEFVIVTNCDSKFYDQCGRIEKVDSIDYNSFPYVIMFYSGGVQYRQEFHSKELKLMDGFDGEERKQNYYNEIKMYDLRKKI